MATPLESRRRETAGVIHRCRHFFVADLENDLSAEQDFPDEMQFPK